MTTFSLSDDARDDLCDKLCSGGVTAGSTAVRELMSDGLSVRQLYIEVLKPVAERLDQLWNLDRVSFVEVGVAMVRLENIVRERMSPDQTFVTRSYQQAIFASVPGDMHTAGLRMAADLQRSNGWDIHLILSSSVSELLSQVELSPARILGLSIGSRKSMHPLYTLVRSIRVSRPDVKVLVGGSLVAADQHPFQLLGVDAFAASFDEAESKLQEWAEEAENA